MKNFGASNISYYFDVYFKENLKRKELISPANSLHTKYST